MANGGPDPLGILKRRLEEIARRFQQGLGGRRGEAGLRQARLGASDEPAFQRWYAEHAGQQGLDPNPDAPEHFYDYRAAYRAGAAPDSSGHWPSVYKREGHPNLVVGGRDTRTGEPVPTPPPRRTYDPTGPGGLVLPTPEGRARPLVAPSSAPRPEPTGVLGERAAERRRDAALRQARMLGTEAPLEPPFREPGPDEEPSGPPPRIEAPKTIREWRRLRREDPLLASQLAQRERIERYYAQQPEWARPPIQALGGVYRTLSPDPIGRRLRELERAGVKEEVPYSSEVGRLIGKGSELLGPFMAPGLRAPAQALMRPGGRLAARAAQRLLPGVPAAEALASTMGGFASLEAPLGAMESLETGGTVPEALRAAGAAAAHGAVSPLALGLGLTHGVKAEVGTRVARRAHAEALARTRGFAGATGVRPGDRSITEALMARRAPWTPRETAGELGAVTAANVASAILLTPPEERPKLWAMLREQGPEATMAALVFFLPGGARDVPHARATTGRGFPERPIVAVARLGDQPRRGSNLLGEVERLQKEGQGVPGDVLDAWRGYLRERSEEMVSPAELLAVYGGSRQRWGARMLTPEAGTSTTAVAPIEALGRLHTTINTLPEPLAAQILVGRELRPEIYQDPAALTDPRMAQHYGALPEEALRVVRTTIEQDVPGILAEAAQRPGVGRNTLLYYQRMLTDADGRLSDMDQRIERALRGPPLPGVPDASAGLQALRADITTLRADIDRRKDEVQTVLSSLPAASEGRAQYPGEHMPPPVAPTTIQGRYPPGAYAERMIAFRHKTPTEDLVSQVIAETRAMGAGLPPRLLNAGRVKRLPVEEQFRIVRDLSTHREKGEAYGPQERGLAALARAGVDPQRLMDFGESLASARTGGFIERDPTAPKLEMVNVTRQEVFGEGGEREPGPVVAFDLRRGDQHLAHVTRAPHGEWRVIIEGQQDRYFWPRDYNAGDLESPVGVALRVLHEQAPAFGLIAPETRSFPQGGHYTGEKPWGWARGDVRLRTDVAPGAPPEKVAVDFELQSDVAQQQQSQASDFVPSRLEGTPATPFVTELGTAGREGRLTGTAETIRTLRDLQERLAVQPGEPGHIPAGPERTALEERVDAVAGTEAVAPRHVPGSEGAATRAAAIRSGLLRAAEDPDVGWYGIGGSRAMVEGELKTKTASEPWNHEAVRFRVRVRFRRDMNRPLVEGQEPILSQTGFGILVQFQRPNGEWVQSTVRGPADGSGNYLNDYTRENLDPLTLALRFEPSTSMVTADRGTLQMRFGKPVVDLVRQAHQQWQEAGYPAQFEAVLATDLLPAPVPIGKVGAVNTYDINAPKEIQEALKQAGVPKAQRAIQDITVQTGFRYGTPPPLAVTRQPPDFESGGVNTQPREIQERALRGEIWRNENLPPDHPWARDQNPYHGSWYRTLASPDFVEASRAFPWVSGPEHFDRAADLHPDAAVGFEPPLPPSARKARNWVYTTRTTHMEFAGLGRQLVDNGGMPFSDYNAKVRRHAPVQLQVYKLAWRRHLPDYAKGVRYLYESKGWDLVLPGDVGLGAGILPWRPVPETLTGQARSEYITTRRRTFDAAVRAEAANPANSAGVRRLLAEAVKRADWAVTRSRTPAASLRHALRGVLSEQVHPEVALQALPESVQRYVEWRPMEWPEVSTFAQRDLPELAPRMEAAAGVVPDPGAEAFRAYMARYPNTPGALVDVPVHAVRLTPEVRAAILRAPPGYAEGEVGGIPMYSGPVPFERGPSATWGAIGAGLAAAPAVARNEWEDVLPRAFMGGIAGGIAGGRFKRALDLRRAAQRRTRAQQAEGPYFGLVRPEAARLLYPFGGPGHFGYADMAVRRMLHEVGRPVPRDATWEEALSRFDDFYGEDPARATALAESVAADYRWMEPLPTETSAPGPTRREFLGALGAGAAGLAGLRGAPPAEAPAAPSMGEFLRAYNRWKYSPDVLASAHAAVTAREAESAREQAGWRGATERTAAPAGRPSRSLREQFRPLFTGDAMDLTPSGMAFSGPYFVGNAGLPKRRRSPSTVGSFYGPGPLGPERPAGWSAEEWLALRELMRPSRTAAGRVTGEALTDVVAEAERRMLRRVKRGELPGPELEGGEGDRGAAMPEALAGMTTIAGGAALGGALADEDDRLAGMATGALAGAGLIGAALSRRARGERGFLKWGAEPERPHFVQESLRRRVFRTEDPRAMGAASVETPAGVRQVPSLPASYAQALAERRAKLDKERGQGRFFEGPDFVGPEDFASRAEATHPFPPGAPDFDPGAPPMRPSSREFVTDPWRYSAEGRPPTTEPTQPAHARAEYLRGLGVDHIDDWMRAAEEGGSPPGPGSRGAAGRGTVGALTAGGLGALGGAALDDEDRLRGAGLGAAAGLGLFGGALAARRGLRGRGRRGATALGPAPALAPEAPTPPGTREPVGGRASLPQVVRADDYVNFAKFDLDPTGEQRLRTEVERLVQEVGIHPKQRVPWAETRRLANELGIDAHGLRDSEVNRRLSGPEMLAIRNLISSNLYAMDRWASDARQPTRTLAEKEELGRRINAAELQNRALLERFIKARTETGRDLNNLKIVANRTLDPVYWVTLAQRYTAGEPVVTLPNGQRVTQADVQTTVTRLARERNREALVTYMMGLRRAGPVEKAQTLWKAGLLTAPPTHMVNFGSNLTMAMLEGLKENVGLLADRVIGLAAAGVGRLPGGTPIGRPERTMSAVGLKVVRESLRGARAGLREAGQVLRGAPLPEALQRYDIRRETNYDSVILNAYTKGVFRSLEASDRVFRGFALRGSLTAQAQTIARAEGHRGVEYRQRVAELLERPTDAMALQAITDAEVATFKEQTTLSEWASPMARHKVGGFILPFSRTPAAVATSVGRYTPFGLAGAAWDVGTVLKAAYRGERMPDIQRRAARRFGRAAIGSYVIWVGYQLAKDDRMTGGYPTTSQSERELWEATGRQANSLRIGDTWYGLGRISPLGNLLAVGANLYEIERRRETPASFLEQATEGGASIAKTVADQPFLTGLRDITEAAQDPLEAGAKVGRQFAGSFIPAGVAAAARGLDPYQRDTRSLESHVQSRIPFASQQAAPKVTTFGEPVRRPGGGVSRFLQEFLNPLRPRPDLRATDPVRRELWDVGWAPARERRDPRETAWQGAERQAAVGPAIREATEATMTTGAYADAQARETQARRDAELLRREGVKLPLETIVEALLAENPDFVTRAEQLRRATGRARGAARKAYLGERP